MHYIILFIIFITYRDRFGSFVWESLAVTSSPRFREGDATIMLWEYVVGSPECEFGSSLAHCRCRFFEGPFSAFAGAAQEN